jgi:endonuclease III
MMNDHTLIAEGGGFPMASRRRSVVKVLLDRYGHTYAQQAGIRLADRPSPLYQLLVLATLLSARISADVAVAAARELFAAGYRTPQRMFRASWQDRVDALGRGHYRRYDERTATMLGEAAQMLRDRWQADLRNLHEEAGSDPKRLRELLIQFKGIGPTGADIFLREVQGVWPDIAPYVDARVSDGAEKLGLPTRARELSGLVDSPRDMARLASALVRTALAPGVADEVMKAAKNPG